MDFGLLGLRAVQSCSQDGLLATLAKGLKLLRRRCPADDDFDIKYGTDTGGFETLWRFRIPSATARFGRHYVATNEQELVDAINYLHVDVRRFTFIDLGCGKGRTLLVAANMGFRRAIGVEFVPDLVAIARSNLAKMGISNAIVLQADAADYHYSDHDMVLYFYAPFSQEVMRRVCTNLHECRPKKLYVVYKVAECAQLLDSCSFLRCFGCPPGHPDIQIWSTVD